MNMRTLNFNKLVIGWSLLLSMSAVAKTQPIAIVIHGGAGTINKSQMTPSQLVAYETTLNQAVSAGYTVLENGGNSLTAVTTAIEILENSPLFNAGKGAVYTDNATHELDASIMRGDTLAAGAVAGVTIVKNPIKLAVAIMEKSEHVFLAGIGAEQFAKEQQLELVDNQYFDTDFRLQQLIKAKSLQQEKQKHVAMQAQHAYTPLLIANNIPTVSPRLQADWPVEFNMGTVGAVAIDRLGNLVAGTSTGGMTAKKYGRIGDAPVIGAGNYANNQSCGVSATGHGEFFIRYHVAADICARVKYQKLSAKTAADQVIAELKKVGGTGGVIVLDPQGNASWSFNTEGMYRAKKVEGQPVEVAIFAEDQKTD